MKKKHSGIIRRTFASATAAVMLAATAIPGITMTAFADQPLISIDFDNGASFPFFCAKESYAVLRQSFENGVCNIQIESSGKRREDCQFLHEGLKIIKGHRYHLHAELCADAEGAVYTYIGPRIHGEDYPEDIWRNAMFGTADAVGYEPITDEEDWHSWESLIVSPDNPLVIDAEFTAARGIDNAVWSFMFGYNDVSTLPSFPYAATLTFDNIRLTDLDADPVPPIKRENAFHVNQMGYFADGAKRATLHSDKPITAKQFYVIASETKEIVLDAPLTPGKDYPDPASGMYTATADFSDLKTPGRYYLSLNGQDEDSYSFEIGSNIYSGLTTDALNYFYLNRAGIPIREAYVSNPGSNSSAKQLTHNQYGHNPDSAYIQSKWFVTNNPDGVFDIEMTNGQVITTKGWYDADVFSKNVPNGANAVWMLQNMYEWSLDDRTGTSSRTYADGSGVVLTDETGDGIPDILNEARYELEFLHDMIVKGGYKLQDPHLVHDTGEYTGMVFYQIQDPFRTDLGIHPWNYKKIGNYASTERIVQPPTTYSTLAASAAFAQASRVFKDCDKDFADQMLKDAVTTYEAAKKNPELDCGRHSLIDLYIDESPWNQKYFFWAAAELYTATGKDTYLNDIKDMIADITVPFSENDPSGMGMLSLCLHSDMLRSEKELQQQLTNSIVSAASELVTCEEEEGFGLPYQMTELYDPGAYTYKMYCYEKGSNAIVLNNGIVTAYAYMLTGDQQYLDAAVGAMDYVFGRNAMDISYVTSYGTNAVSQPAHNAWYGAMDNSFPFAPGGVLVGGPYSLEHSNVSNAAGINDDTPAQCCYVDSMRTVYINQCRVSWNASLAWMAGFLEEHGSIAEPEYLLGDLSRDGTLESTDIAILQHYLNGGMTMTETYFKIADMNQDQTVNAKDLTLLKRAILAIKKEQV